MKSIKTVLAILAAIVVLGLLGTGILSAGGFTQGSQSKPVKITTPTDEPIGVELISAIPPSIVDEYAVYPGQPQVLTYEVYNRGPISYVVAVVPSITGTWQQAPEWELRLVGPAYPPFEFSQGFAHILVEPGQKVTVELWFMWPRGITINPLPSATVVLNATRTNCWKVKDCPWG
ncbi:MAG: hypothetical protein HYS60_01720 [Candidatus Wildermuthbacteria bacterium]|nr:hypothetical protein [Candidatus Wildermuthbacteria bacterium]